VYLIENQERGSGGIRERKIRGREEPNNRCLSSWGSTFLLFVLKELEESVIASPAQQ
jgi:hypothetical protein